MNPNRNPKLSQPDIEERLCRELGAKRVLWLDHGHLEGDDTDSHVDTLARLCPNDTILYVKCSDKNDAHYEDLLLMEKDLQNLRTIEGKPYRLLALPMARPVFYDGERLPATYANFLILNESVLLPAYDDPETDERAKRVVEEAFPTRSVVMIDSRILVRQHGSIHCATMQFPRGVMD